jgi:hypothetical protein
MVDRLERNPSNSAHLEVVQGGYFSMKKPLEGRASGYACSDSAVGAARGNAAAPRAILELNGVLMYTRGPKDLLSVPAKKRWSRSRARCIGPRNYLRVLPTRTRPSLFGGD